MKSRCINHEHEITVPAVKQKLGRKQDILAEEVVQKSQPWLMNLLSPKLIDHSPSCHFYTAYNVPGFFDCENTCPELSPQGHTNMYL